MTIIEYAEKIGVLKYLSNDMFGILNEWQKAYEDGIDLNMVFGIRGGKVLLSSLIQKYTGYMEGYKDGRAEAIDEMKKVLNSKHATIQFSEQTDVNSITLFNKDSNWLVEQLKEQSNVEQPKK